MEDVRWQRDDGCDRGQVLRLAKRAEHDYVSRWRGIMLHLYFFYVFVHILCMASIYHCDSIAIDRVGKVPPIGIGHVVTSPLGDGWLATEESILDAKDRENRVLNVTFEISLIIRMTVFLRHILIKREDLTRCTRLDDITIISHWRRYHQSLPKSPHITVLVSYHDPEHIHGLLHDVSSRGPHQ